MKAQDLLLGNKAAKNQGQMSVEEARAAMIAAGELPSGLSKEHKKNTAVSANPAPVVTQTPTVVRSAASQRNEETITGPTEIVAILTYIHGDQEQIVVADKEALVAAVDARRQKLQDAGQPTRIAVQYQLRPAGSTVSAVTETAAPAQNQPSIQTGKKGNEEREETKDFVATIRQEGGQWIGELVYKNGAGSERFVAPTKNSLTMKMLIGKGHASVKVRKVIREQKLGVELDQAYTFEGITQEQFDAMPDAARQQLIDKQAMEAALAFKAEHPEYLSIDENWDKIRRFLDKKRLPYTYVNLEYAYDDLTSDEMLQVRETAPTVVADALSPEDSGSVATVTAQSAPAAVATAAPAPQLRKRGTTGLQPGFSSAGFSELELTEDGNKSRELSAAELKALPLSEHKKLYRASLKQPNRQF